MKINGFSSLSEVAGLAASRYSSAARLDSAQGPADSVNVSTRARDIAGAKDAIAALPDVRSDRVATLRAVLASGTYHVPAHSVASRMLAQAAV